MMRKKPGPKKVYTKQREKTVIKLTAEGRRAIYKVFPTLQAAINWLEEYAKKKSKL